MTVPLLVPPLAIQSKITSILCAYDDLIENNLRRVALFEETARLLYQEWFVNFRFPGYEYTKMVDGVPKGWLKCAVKDVCRSIQYGYTASADVNPVGPKLLRITDIVPEVIEWAKVPHCIIPDDKREKYLLCEGDILVARTGATSGWAKRIHKRCPDAVFASYLVRLQVNKEILDDIILGIFIESQNYKDFIRANMGGAAQPNANAQVISSASILVPPIKLQFKFRRLVEPILDQKEILAIQNQKLKQARDLLLPKLMSGEVMV